MDSNFCERPTLSIFIDFAKDFLTFNGANSILVSGNVRDFISAKECLYLSEHFLLDYCLQSVSEVQSCIKPKHNLESLKFPSIRKCKLTLQQSGCQLLRISSNIYGSASKQKQATLRKIHYFNFSNILFLIAEAFVCANIYMCFLQPSQNKPLAYFS